MLLLLALLSIPRAARAQDTDSVPFAAAPAPPALVLPGDPYEDRQRLLQILGTRSTAGALLRMPSARIEPLERRAARLPRIQILPPRMRTVWNSRIPFSLNEGTMWAGHGMNLKLLAGGQAEWGPVSLVFAPELVYQENRDFQIFHYPGEDRSAFSSPWHLGHNPLDLPLRFGDRSFTTFWLGQSSLTVRAGPVAGGVATENQWWGPGLRNGIVLSSNAPGFPHAFLRTSRPVATRLGEFEGRWVVGTLTESLFFDTISRNDLRSISGAAVTFRPAVQPNLTVGVARTVISPSGELEVLPGRALDVFRASHPTAAANDTLPQPRAREQLYALFGRWIFPADGMEIYAEWARLRLPSSFRDLITAPNHTQGYTLGLQWVRPLRPTRLLRLQGEVTDLEMSATYRQRHVPTFYKSEVVAQGYTHRGQVLGAAIGPGASSQWLAADYLVPRWSAGVFGGRIRWENDTFYGTTYEGQPRNWHGHDVSLFAGLRSTFRTLGTDVSAEYTLAKRYNYLFQNPGTSPIPPEGTVDLWNHTLRISLVPRLAR
jgi:hypothetical protein